MAGERYVLLGLAHVRSEWFREVAHWSTSASLPIEFLKAMSVEEVRVRLRGGRAYSALLVDDGVVGVDRDLLDLARTSGCAVVVVDHGRTGMRWAELGVSRVLPAAFGRTDLLQVLQQVASPIARTEDGPAPLSLPGPAAGFRAPLVAVTGAGGVGRSTVAMAVAQGLADDPRHGGLVCLADLALHADHAMLHASPDVVPGVVELVEAHRVGAPPVETIRSLTWQVDDRGYHLLLGLRRHRDWTAVRPRAFEAGLDGLRRAFRVVVADIDDDLEGERTSGSVDVEDRNVMARTVTSSADLVLTVGTPGMKGLHSLLRTVRDVLDHGVPGTRLVPVINHAPRSARHRAELTRAFGELLTASRGAAGVPSPVHVPTKRNLEPLLRDGARLPGPWLAPVVSTVSRLLEGTSPAPTRAVDRAPVPITPGALGSWTEQDGDGAAEGVG